MLTLAKILVYERFGGDSDGYSRCRDRENSSVITDAEWRLMQRIIQSIHLMEAGLTTDIFRKRAEHELNAVTADQSARDALWRLARR